MGMTGEYDMAKDLMRYDLMAQDALRGVVRHALPKAQAPEGLPGPHHFYITFRTTAPGVDIDPTLLEGVLGVRREYLEASMAELAQVHGSIEAYFTDGLKIDASTQDQLRSNLLS